jgi:hypothetical protein
MWLDIPVVIFHLKGISEVISQLGSEPSEFFVF